MYHDARFTTDKKSIEASVRPRKGSAAICSHCHQAGRGSKMEWLLPDMAQDWGLT